MLAHLPGRMSQPSRKGVTSNIFILRCSFHKTAKRLSITGLTHLLRLRSKIQSSIVRHNKMSVPVKIVILLQQKRKRNTKYHKNFKTNTKQSSLTILVFQMTIKHKKKKKKNHGLDYFTETNSPKASN